jgi:hypothetical protein
MDHVTQQSKETCQRTCRGPECNSWKSAKVYRTYKSHHKLKNDPPQMIKILLYQSPFVVTNGNIDMFKLFTGSNNEFQIVKRNSNFVV